MGEKRRSCQLQIAAGRAAKEVAAEEDTGAGNTQNRP
jgi:hypothetical protein